MKLRSILRTSVHHPIRHDKKVVHVASFCVYSVAPLMAMKRIQMATNLVNMTQLAELVQ